MSYQFYPSQHWSPLVRFNGFKVSSGLSYSTFDASFATPFNLTQGDGTYDMTWNNTVNVGVSSSVWSFTNEATAGIAVLGVVNLYAGVGLDFNVGSTAVVGGSAGPVTAVQSGTSTQVFSGTATISSDSSGVGPTFAQTRFLLGTEFGVGPVGLYLQGQVANPSTYGLNFGAHFLF
jgi:hypothetical protein